VLLLQLMHQQRQLALDTLLLQHLQELLLQLWLLLLLLLLLLLRLPLLLRRGFVCCSALLVVLVSVRLHYKDRQSYDSYV
jgi:hypothetical protein